MENKNKKLNENQNEKEHANAAGIKRKLSDYIDESQYVISRGTKRAYDKKLTVSDNGTIKLNSTFVNATKERRFAVAFSKNFEKVILVSECEEEICFSKNGTARDRDIAGSITHIGLDMPLTYILRWDEKRKLWLGKIDKHSDA